MSVTWSITLNSSRDFERVTHSISLRKGQRGSGMSISRADVALLQ